MDNKEIRRRNLLRLKQKYEKKLGKKKATWNILAEKWGTDGPYLMQIKSEKTDAYMGDAVARSIEKGEQEQIGWMDIPHVLDLENEVREPAQVIYDLSDFGELSEAERKILKLWRGWNPTIKQYVLGQMKIADYTKDVLASMFLIENKDPVTDEQIDEIIIDSVSNTGEFKKISDGQ